MLARVSVLVVAAALFPALAAPAQPDGQYKVGLGGARVEVAGEARGDLSYDLSVSFEAASLEEAGDGLLIFAEPSHTLLYAHANRHHPELVGEFRDKRRALAVTAGDPQATMVALTIPYTPTLGRNDDRIEVLVRHAGDEILMVSAGVDTFSFSFSSTVPSTRGLKFLRPGDSPLSLHCCRGGTCAQMCISCPNNFFFCDLINCTIECSDPPLARR